MWISSTYKGNFEGLVHIPAWTLGDEDEWLATYTPGDTRNQLHLDEPKLTELETSDGRMRVVPIAELRKWDGWKKALAAGVKDHRYYEIVAETLGFDCRAAVVEDQAGELRAVQPFFFADIAPR